MLNRPINLNDPTGHDPWWDDPDFYYADLQTYIKAGITVQKENGLRSRGAVYLVDPLLGKDTRHTGIGPAKISDAQMETPYGDPVIDSSGHNRGYGLGMRTQSCGNACPPDVVDQDDDNMAKVAMGRRITLAIKACMTSCTPTDIYLAAALAENGPGFTQQNMHDLMYNKKTLPRSTSGPAMLDWKDFLNDPNHTDSNQENKFLINSFTSAINDLPVPPGLDWNFITQVSQP